MYSSVPIPDRGSGKQGGLLAGPLLGLCCLLFCLFLIAATIVLALIPIYLPQRDVTPSAGATTETYSIVADFDGSLGSDGQFDAAGRDAVARSIERARNLPTGSVSVKSVTVATTPNKRRRRSLFAKRFRRGITDSGLQLLYIIFVLLRAICGLCVLNLDLVVLVFSLIYNGVEFNIAATGQIQLIPSATTPTTLSSTTVSTVTTTTTATTATTITTATTATTVTTATMLTTVTTANTTTTVTTATTTAATTASVVG